MSNINNRHLQSSSYPKASMASSNNRSSSNLNVRKIEPRRKISTVPEMSPEARRATLLAREDSKTNINSNTKKKKTSNSSSSTSQGFQTSTDYEMSHDIDTNNNKTSSVRRKESQQNDATTTQRIADLNAISSHQSSSSTRNAIFQNSKLSSPSSRPPRAPKTGTARSRSTLSQNEPPFSMSDNNELSSYLGTNTTSNASVYTSNLSSRGNNNNNNIFNSNSVNNVNNSKTLINNNNHFTNPADDDDNDSALPNDESFEDEEEDEEETKFNKNSFVRALDQALEKNYVSRLKGDITDTARVSKPGTVRALNGGRLTNAQEVVVNVCHNDDTELVFHDDDDESIDTAKAISEIRVNIWMEYNSSFPPDNNLHEFDSNNSISDDGFEDKRNKFDSLQTIRRTTRQPSAPVSVANKSRERTSTTISRKPAGQSLSVGGGGAGSVKGSSRNNNNTTANSDKSKTSNTRLRSIPPSPTPSRRSSATSSRGKVNSMNSSTTKPTTPLRTRR